MMDYHDLIRRLRSYATERYLGARCPNLVHEAADAIKALVEERDETAAALSKVMEGERYERERAETAGRGLAVYEEGYHRVYDENQQLLADLAAARAALIEAQEGIVQTAFSTGYAANGEFDHGCMSDAEWLVRECGFDGRCVPLDDLGQAMKRLPEKLANAAIEAAREG